MPNYLNPGCAEFAAICSTEYVDKTEMLCVMDSLLCTKNSLLLVSRPRRFGKSYAAAMLCAYYGYGSQARPLFQDKIICKRDPELTHFGEYNVIYLDMTRVKAEALQKQREMDRIADRRKEPRKMLDWIAFLEKEITAELRKAFGRKGISYSFFKTLENVVDNTGRKFLWLCDEWDLFFREEIQDPNAAENYLELLRSLFKTSDGYTQRVFAGAYLTGILPMKKMKGESAISSFDNYTMLEQGALAPFTGFTKDEVKELCRKYSISFEKMSEWYDGYKLAGAESVYNPRSVMEAIRLRAFDSYWTNTASYEKLKLQIELNLAGLRETILAIVSGAKVRIDGQKFDNDIRSLKDTNEVLTALVHLGYLSYNSEEQSVRIPNKELRQEFISTLARSSHEETARMIQTADELLEETWKGNEKKVAEVLALTHRATGDTKYYNSEARLSETIRLAYYTAADHYVTVRELAAGEGFADVVFLPKRGSEKPLMIVELKWDRPVDSAIKQILDRKYPSELAYFGGKVLLVGITYMTRGKKHVCKIIEYKKK